MCVACHIVSSWVLPHGRADEVRQSRLRADHAFHIKLCSCATVRHELEVTREAPEARPMRLRCDAVESETVE